MKLRTAFYPGSFDPFTNGHRDVLQKSVKLFDRIIVGIGVHESKKNLFSFDERASFIEDSLTNFDGKEKIEILHFKRLMIEEAKKNKASFILRGVRNHIDLDYEIRLSSINASMNAEILTIFIPTSIENSMVSSTFIKQIASMGGDVSSFVPESVAMALKIKYNGDCV